MNKREKVIEDVFAELKRAEEKFPLFPTDAIHGAAIVAEESGELIQASLDFYYGNGSAESMRNEAIQTAAMALRFLFAWEEE